VATLQVGLRLDEVLQAFGHDRVVIGDEDSIAWSERDFRFECSPFARRTFELEHASSGSHALLHRGHAEARGARSGAFGSNPLPSSRTASVM